MPDLGNTDCVAVLPWRAGSQGVVGKNLRLLNGKPLYMHALEQSLRVIGRCVVTTDIEEVISEKLPANCSIVRRPASLAENQTPMAPVLMHLFSTMERLAPLPEIAVLLQATSPLRRDSDIHDALKLYRKAEHELVLSVTRTDSSILKYGLLESGSFKPVSSSQYCFSNRQSLPPVFRPNGAVYVFSPRTFLETGDFPSDRIGAVEIPDEYALDIDTESDLANVEDAFRNPILEDA